MKAKDVLTAVRKYKLRAAVLREVTIGDQQQRAIANRQNLETYPEYYEKYYAAHPEHPIADSVPEGWSGRTSKFERRIDALILDDKRTAVEIKVSRADFKTETEDKRAPWVAVTHRFIYACPEGLILPEEVPDYAGLWYVDPATVGSREWYRHGIKVAKRAKLNKNPADLPPYLIKSLMGRLSRYEWDREKEGK